MKSTIVGPYLRFESELGETLRKELGKPEKDYLRIQQLRHDLTREVVQEMVARGIDLPNYGLIDVHDEITWPLEFVNGVRFGGIKKIFHTNTHYKESIIENEIRRERPLVSSLYRTALEVYPQVKIEFPGPYTLAKHSVRGDGYSYGNLEDLARAYARMYREELLELKDVPLVQFNEPSIIGFARQSEDVRIVPELYAMMLEGLKLPVAVWTYYGLYSIEVLDMLFSLPVDLIGLDFVWDGNLPNLLKRISHDKGIGFGIIDSCDGGSLKLEKPEDILRILKGLEGHIDFSKALISSNATLEHSPRDYARNKLAVINEVARRVNT